MAEQAQVTSQELCNHLYKACDILRGPINQDEFKSYVTPILFFKRLSDVYDEETADALEMSGGDEEFAALPENHSFVIPENCHWVDVRNATKDVGKAIAEAMTGIERANPDTLSGLFSSFDDASWSDKTKLTDDRLKDLVEHFSKKKFGNENYGADVMGDAYEYLIKKFADDSKKNAGEFYTPRTIVNLMVRLLAPMDGESVYDPACGTGGMLIEATRAMSDKRLAYGRVFGQEKNLGTSAIARMNLFLHGARDFSVVQGDTLRAPAFTEAGKLRRFDCVLANPPFSLKNWGADAFASDSWGRNIWGSLTDKTAADLIWLQHMVCSMDESSGRCAVILPQGVLFHGGKEGKIREKLIKSDKIEAIITLASGVFFSTGVSACILFLNNNKQSSKKGRICLIDGSQVFTPQRAQNVLSQENADELYGYYTAFEDVIERCRVVTLDDVKSQGYVLSVSNYIERKKEEIEPPEAVRARYLKLLKETNDAEEKLRRLLEEGGYLHG